MGQVNEVPDEAEVHMRPSAAERGRQVREVCGKFLADLLMALGRFMLQRDRAAILECIERLDEEDEP